MESFMLFQKVHTFRTVPTNYYGDSYDCLLAMRRFTAIVQQRTLL